MGDGFKSNDGLVFAGEIDCKLWSKCEHRDSAMCGPACDIMRVASQCKWSRGWGAMCDGIAVRDGFCTEHSKTLCSRCGMKAVRSCHVTWGPLCCGKPLCDGCDCTCVADGHP